MPDPRIVECSFFIPIHGDAALSDGDPHPGDYWVWLFDELFNRFGGGTLAPALWEGSTPILTPAPACRTSRGSMLWQFQLPISLCCEISSSNAVGSSVRRASI